MPTSFDDLKFRNDFFGRCRQAVCAVCGKKIDVDLLRRGKSNCYLPHLRQIYGEELVDVAQITFTALRDRNVIVCAQCNYDMRHSDSVSEESEEITLFKLENSLDRVFIPARKERAEEEERAENVRKQQEQFLSRFQAGRSPQRN